MVAISTVACADEKDGNAIDKRQGVEPPQVAVSLHTLLDSQKTYKDHKVIIAAYFVTHMEGPWICAENGDWRKRLETTLAVKNLAATKFKLLGPTRSRIKAIIGRNSDGKTYPDAIIDSLALHLGDFKDGVPSLITGTFRVGHYSYPNGINLEDHPFIELEEIQEVDAGDPRWKAAQQKG